jgi:preprotein translocase subunit SecG
MIPLFYVTMTFFVLVCAILILLILIQKGRGGGLASAFGGAGGQTAFGSKTGDVLTWATSVVFGIFVVLAVTLNLEANHIDTVRHAGTALLSTPTPAPVMPESPSSSLPKAPTAPPGVTQPPPLNPGTVVTLPATQTMAPDGVGPATLPAVVQHVIDRVPVSTTFPTTLP